MTNSIINLCLSSGIGLDHGKSHPNDRAAADHGNMQDLNDWHDKEEFAIFALIVLLKWENSTVIANTIGQFITGADATGSVVSVHKTHDDLYETYKNE